MKQITFPAFAIATLMASPLMAQSAVEPGIVAHHGSSAPMARGGSRGCMEKTLGMAQHMEGRMAFMRTKLKITNEQMPQWNAFAEAMHDNARRMIEMRGKMGPAASKSVPESLDRMEKMTAAIVETAQSTKAAFMPLYSAFSAEQKKTADELAPVGFGWG